MQNETKATITLAASAVLAASTMPNLSPLINYVTTTTGSFIVGLLNHGFIAATIGGLAHKLPHGNFETKSRAHHGGSY